MSEINRSVIIVKPRKPFLDWVRSLDDESKDLTLEMHEDSTGYLIPEIWEDSDEQEFLKTCYDILFEEQLEGWWTDEAAWPQQRDLKMFLEWFEVDFHSLVFDLCDEPIRTSMTKMIFRIRKQRLSTEETVFSESCHSIL